MKWLEKDAQSFTCILRHSLYHSINANIKEDALLFQLKFGSSQRSYSEIIKPSNNCFQGIPPRQSIDFFSLALMTIWSGFEVRRLMEKAAINFRFVQKCRKVRVFF